MDEKEWAKLMVGHCDSCKFFHATLKDKEVSEGTCKRYPTEVRKRRVDECGEWKESFQ